MIPRYSRQEMVSVWSQETKYNIWRDIEVYACEALGEIGIIPEESVKNIRKNAKFDIDQIDDIEKIVKHDVIAFLTSMAENIGEDSRFVHRGLTSSDILDTCLAVQLVKATDILIKDIDKVLLALKNKAQKYKNLVTMGRSHGIHAEPITFGLKLAKFYTEFERNKARLLQAKSEISKCKLSGAVGTFANVDPYVETYVANKLGLEPELISTQIIPRDRHAMYFATLGVIASSIENIAIEIRHLQRTEVLEVEEEFSKGQKGSSAMPHKKNPILSENITGLARIVRSYVTPALENVALWHERDISHSSVERVIAPDATINLDFALNRLANIIENLVVHPKNIEANFNKLKGVIFSQRILLLLVEKGMSRENAYSLIQSSAMKTWETEATFQEDILENKEIMQHISQEELSKMFDLSYYTKNIDFIFKRVFKE